MVTIYHNSRCAKSRAGLKFLQDNSIDYRLVEYLKEGITADTVKVFSQKTGLPAIDLVRKQEDYYKKNLKGKELSEEEWFVVIAENPKLLQRPIVVNGDKAVLAQPPENINTIL